MITDNLYTEYPLCISQISHSSGEIIQSYFFLGNVSKTVLTAAQSVKYINSKLIWSEQSAKILQEKYGKGWEILLTPPNVPNGLSVSAEKYGGGVEFENSAFDIEDFEIKEETERPEIAANERFDDDNYYSATSLRFDIDINIDGSKIPIYSDVCVYSEDTVFDLMYKIQYVSKVPYYRQHFFYTMDNSTNIYLPYKLSIEGDISITDWRSIAAKPSESSILNLHIDTFYETHRNDIKIDALDTFITLCGESNNRIKSGFFIDLFTVIAPITSTVHNNPQLRTILRDQYQLDLLYYGNIIKYWPQVTINTFVEAMIDPYKLMKTHTKLHPSTHFLELLINTERTVINKANQWDMKNNIPPEVFVSAATIDVPPMTGNTYVNIRNVADYVATSVEISAIISKFTIDTSDISATSIISLRNDMRINTEANIFVSKRNLSSYNKKVSGTIKDFICQSIRPGVAKMAIVRHSDCEPNIIPYVYLTINYNGSISAKTAWENTCRIDFSEALKILISSIKPIIMRINNLKSTAFPIGGNIDISSSSQSSFGIMSLYSLWAHSISSDVFDEICKKFIILEKANIITIKNAVSPNTFTFMFKKGITEYNFNILINTLSRMASSNLGVESFERNQYIWLTDPTIMAKWQSAFNGRLIRLVHRVADIKIDYIEVDGLYEYDLIKKYIYSILDDFIGSKSNTIYSNILEVSTTPTASRRLRRLHERDPDLFDIKKYDASLRGYSILCQSGRQPYTYNEKEKDELSVKKQNKLVKYWNYTNQEPAYYSCPDPEFPHLSFRSNQHPLGYCLPCCKKTPPIPGSNVDKINKKCINTAGNMNIIDDDLEVGLSRHILSYGKSILEGRLGFIPDSLKNGLFVKSVTAPYGLYMTGVQQSTQTIDHAGFAFSIAFILCENGANQVEVFENIADFVQSMTDTYHILGNGSGQKFDSSDALSEAIRSNFIRFDTDTFSAFGPGGIAENDWQDILIEIVRYIYGIEIIIFSTTESNETIFESTRGSLYAICNSDCNTRPSVGIIMRTGTEYYPIIITNPKLYAKTQINNKWQVIRKIYRCDDTGYVNGEMVDNVVFAINGMIESYQAIENIDYKCISQYSLNEMSKFKILNRLVNIHNMYYGIILQHKLDKVNIYFPIVESTYYIDTNPVIFGIRPREETSYEYLMMAIEDINKFNSNSTYNTIVKVKNLVDANNMCVGFMSNGNNPLYYFHEKIPHESTPEDILFPYDSIEIDKEIFNSIINKWKPPTNQLASKADAKNKLYKFFLAEFAFVLSTERNAILRDRILIELPKIKNSVDLEEIWFNINLIIPEYPEDINKLRKIVTMHKKIETIGEVINNIQFDFDHSIINKCRSITSSVERIKYIKSVLFDRIDVVDEFPDTFNLKNMYTTCEYMKDNTNLCFNKKLIVPIKYYEDMCEILAADLFNPNKQNLLLSIYASVFDPIDFIRRPQEQLKLEIN